MRLLIALVLAASALPAQYFEFAVTDDGRLYFSTPLTTGTGNSRFTVYRLADGRPELVASGTDDNPFGDSASTPLVSGDGSITGWAMYRPCGPSCGLAGLPRIFYQLQGAGIDNFPANSVQVSRNGKFLLIGTYDVRVRIVEVASQRVTEVGQHIGPGGPQGVADNGAILFSDAKSLFFRAPDGETRAIAGSEGARAALLSPAGDRIAFERIRDGRLELVAGNTVVASAPATSRGSFQPRFANDGTLFHLDPDGQPMLLPPGGTSRRLAAIEGGVRTAILSGDGTIAWLATSSGQLLRVHTATAAIDEVIPATPYLAGVVLFGFPGSAVRFSGSGITPGIRFELDGSTLPISAVGDEVVYAQIPWEYPTRIAGRPLLVRGPASPFAQRLEFIPLDRPGPWFERDGGPLKAAHQDFRGLVSASDPARPGETIHVFARNMGPVDRPVATGEPSPDPPARVTTPMACYLSELAPDSSVSRPVGLVVPFAGLSAGLIGVYHIDVTIPEDWQAERAQLSCHMDSGGGVLPGDSAPLDVSPRRPDQP
jgi:uncharacterized protein (TIGR03437 family)